MYLIFLFLIFLKSFGLNLNNFFLSIINKGFFGSGTNILWIMGDSTGKGHWLLGFVSVEGDIGYVTRDMRHLTHDFCLLKVPENPQKCKKKCKLIAKKSQKCRKVSKRRVFIVLVLISTTPKESVSPVG